MEAVYKLALNMVNCISLHVIRQLVNITSLVLLILNIIWYEYEQDKVSLSIACCVAVSIYTIIQNIYFLFLHDRIKLEDCWRSKSQALHAMGITYCIVAVFLCVTSYSLARSILFDRPSEVPLYAGIWFTCAAIFQVTLDSYVLHMLCPAIFVSTLALLVLLLASFSAAYFLHLLWCKRCKNGEREELERKKVIIKDTLKKVTGRYKADSITLKTFEAPTCAICLQSFSEGAEVVVLDCSETHIFHANCACEWLCQANVCPMCRAPVLPEGLYLF